MYVVEMMCRTNKVGEVLDGMKRTLKCTSHGMNAKRRLYE